MIDDINKMSDLNTAPELTRAERSYVMVGYMLAFQDFMLKPHAPVIAQLVQEKGDRPTIAMLNTMADIAKTLEKMSLGDKEYV
jgi:hypothetical protein